MVVRLGVKLAALEEPLEKTLDLSYPVNCRSELSVLKGFIIVIFSAMESFMETKCKKYRITLTKICTCLTYKTATFSCVSKAVLGASAGLPHLINSAVGPPFLQLNKVHQVSDKISLVQIDICGGLTLKNVRKVLSNYN